MWDQMLSAIEEHSVSVLTGTRLARYAAVIFFGFGCLYLLTRSSILIGDANTFIALARAGDPAQLHYGEPSHFLQVPLARAIWRSLNAVAVPAPLAVVFLGLSLVGTLLSIVFVGLIAAEVFQTEDAAWLAALLYGSSLHAFTQWNGELYGMALGGVTAALFLALRGRVVAAACLWALAVLSHSDFVLAAPAFVAATWIRDPDRVATSVRVRRAATLLTVAGAMTVVVLLLASWSLGKWSDRDSLVRWVGRSYETRQPDVSPRPEVFRALKGLATAYTVGGHYWRDILTGRGQYDRAGFVPAAGIALVVLVVTGGALIAGLWHRRAWFALVWLLPFHVVVNWWFVPTVEKYHAGALPGAVLLVTAGLLVVGTRLQAANRRLLYVAYVAGCAALNLFGAVVPMQALGRDTTNAAREIRQLADTAGGRAVFVACDDAKVLVGASVEFLRLRSVWFGTSADIEQALDAWTRARLGEGKAPYLVGRWCVPDEWKTTATRAPFDLFFLRRSFTLEPTAIRNIPISESVPTNPFNWTRGDVIRLGSD
jgi:hypothetical protein